MLTRFRYEMAKQRIKRTAKDIREHPSYSVSEAAHYLGIPKATLQGWIVSSRYTKNGETRHRPPLIQIADRKHSLLSFYNLIEAHVLVSTRRRKVPMSRVRVAVDYVKETIGGAHPLASYKFATSGKSIFVKKLEGMTVDATKYGQPALGDTLKKYLKGIKFGPVDKQPFEVQPLKPKTLQPSPVVINPYISSGKPVIKDTGIVASIVWKRVNAGEKLPVLARDYGIDEGEIEKVVKYFRATA